MSDYQVIPEIDVLVATTVFLKERGVKPYRISVPKGKGMDKTSYQERIWKILTSNSAPDVFPFSPEGPDIIGISETEWWQVECKGFGSAERSTHVDKFQRGLASVVSYYEEKTKGLPKEYEQYKNAQSYLGLALPASPEYLKELNKRVRQPLRKRLNLWVLLYEPELKSIRAVSPEDSY